jgi:hypothetical protein
MALCDAVNKGSHPSHSKLKFGHAVERETPVFERFLNANLSASERAFIDVAQM